MRDDISQRLIHFTKGDSYEDAYQNLKNIISEQKIYGSNAGGIIKGNAKCVCFSETPLPFLKGGLLNPSFYSQYSPFGVMTSKEHIYNLGGRHVIYQSDSELSQLNDENSWRHMRYEPPDIDLTWEREWRLKTDSFKFESNSAQIVVLDKSWEERLIEEHNQEQQWQTIQLSLIMDELEAVYYEEDCPWKIIRLNTSG